MAQARRVEPIPYDVLAANSDLIDSISLRYGFEKDKLRRSLDTNKHNSMTTTFYLELKTIKGQAIANNAQQNRANDD
jgi:hypothetical protein